MRNRCASRTVHRCAGSKIAGINVRAEEQARAGISGAGEQLAIAAIQIADDRPMRRQPGSELLGEGRRGLKSGESFARRIRS